LEDGGGTAQSKVRKTNARGDDMTTLYKLTDARDCTRETTQWSAGVTHTAPGDGDLCTQAWIHAYRSALLAVMMDSVHAHYLPRGHLWTADGDVGRDDGSKVGCTSLTTRSRVDVPVVTITQRVAFGILAARAVYTEAAWCAWADKWLSGEDRTVNAADDADARTARAARTALAAAALAARTAAADAADAADAAAADAADAARYANRTLDLAAIAQQAVRENPDA